MTPSVYARAEMSLPDCSIPHLNYSDKVNGNVVQSEVEGGMYLDELSEGEVLEVENQNRQYTMRRANTSPKHETA